VKPFVFALLLAGAASAAQTFQVPGCTATAPAAINDLNEVVGTATCGGLATAFIRDAAGHFTTYTIDGKPTTATGVNIHGAVVGSYSVPDIADCIPNPFPLVQCEFGYVRSPNGSITTLNVPGLSGYVRPVAINASGQIAGNIAGNTANDRPQVFLRDDDGTFPFISPGPPPESFISQNITGLTDTGEIVGTGYTGFCCFQAFVRIPVPPSPPFGNNGKVIFVGPSVYPTATFGTGIDRLGAHIIGYAISFNPNNSTTTTQGFTQTPTGLPKLFPVPFAEFASPPGAPGGINSHGEGVLENVYVAPNGVVTTITIPDCTAVMAQAINDLGWVTGSCTLAGESVGFLWRK
jgi:hypothetical protein